MLHVKLGDRVVFVEYWGSTEDFGQLAYLLQLHHILNFQNPVRSENLSFPLLGGNSGRQSDLDPDVLIRDMQEC
jgi:hypothetical protein